MVEYENEVKSHANTHTHTHTQSSTVVIIYAIIGSERDTVRGNTLNSQGYIIVLLASERDTYRGKNEKIGDVCLFFLYICMDVRMSFCTLTLAFFC